MYDPGLLPFSAAGRRVSKGGICTACFRWARWGFNHDQLHLKGASIVIMRRLTSVLTLGAALLLLGSTTVVAVVVPLPDTSQTSVLTATVGSQAEVSVPAGVSFSIVAVGGSTNSANQSVSATSLVLDTGHMLRVSMQANAASFTKPAGGTITWAASDVSWNAPTWTGGTGITGTLSNTAYNTVADSTINATALSTTALKFTLAGKSTVDRAGDHTLVCTWKFECTSP